MARALNPDARLSNSRQGHVMNRRPSNPIGSLRPSQQRGFTVTELVIVVFMVGVLASLAGPMLRDFIIQQNIRSAAFDLMSDLTFARSEAVKRNTTVTMAKAGTWTGGWTVAAGATTFRQHPALSSNITITMASSSVDFLLNGRASGSAKFTVDDAGGKVSIVARCVSVDPSGRPQSVEGNCP
jgi:type IV fimbrial biogenesis protein FimT